MKTPLSPMLGEVRCNDLRHRFDHLRYRLGARRVYEWRGDVIFASYQKSGRTWIRLMLAKCLELHYGVPLSMMLHRVSLEGVPRVLFTHYPESLGYHRRKPAILLTRDPRDTLVSYFHHCVSRKRTFSGDLDAFLGSHYGLPGIVAYYNRIARDLGFHPHVLVISYEQTHENPQGTMMRIFEALALPMPPEVVRQAVEFSRFERVQRMEKNDLLPDERLVRTENKSDPNAFKARRGKVGGHREELTAAQIARIDAYLAANLSIAAGKLLAPASAPPGHSAPNPNAPDSD